jgi:hypothetical protein
MDLRSGDIILVKANKFRTWYRKAFSKLIQLFEGVYYHHAIVVVGDEILEADTKVISISLDKYKGDEILHLRLKKPLTINEEIRYINVMQEMKDAKYDFLSALLFYPLHILSLRRIWLGKTGKSATHKPVCTELGVHGMNKVRGYFPEPWKCGPWYLSTKAPLYYDVIFEGKVQ